MTSNSYSRPPDYEVGEAVTVVYEKDAPQKARIKSHFQMWGIEETLALIGAFFLVYGFSPMPYRQLGLD